MNLTVHQSDLDGIISIPGSKSHTIRALVIALLSKGKSVIREPLESSDTLSCLDMIKSLGAKVEKKSRLWEVTGVGSKIFIPDNVIDIGNSGTSLYIGMGVAALIDGTTIFTGDHQIRNRPTDSLLHCINDLGGKAYSTRNNGKPPVIISGRITGGRTSVEAVTSQYLSALLLAAPLASGETTIDVPLLNEKPYVTMTLNWMQKQNISFTNNNYESFIIPGNQSYKGFDEYIAADFSSATFFLVAAAISGKNVILKGLDFNDTQGDKEVVTILQKMGADITIHEKEIQIKGGELTGGVFDLNAIPDALPALSVAGCFANGTTELINVPQARLKETDRIAVMNQELAKMGANIQEKTDGLVIKKSNLKGCNVHGHYDHRVVMSLSVAGLFANGTTTIDTAESVAITFPNFVSLMNSLGANILEQK